MVWKQSLAKLKQDLKASEGEAARPAPPPKIELPKPEPPKAIEEEDDLFLSAMGVKSGTGKLRAVPTPEAPAETPVRAAAAPADQDFGEAMANLKGMKAMRKPKIAQAAPKAPLPASAPADPEPMADLVPSLPVESLDAPLIPQEPDGEPAAPIPTRIQLAAGMAIEVDGVLDLRGHSRADIQERVKERILDGVCLGWRTLHVILDDALEIHELISEDWTKATPGVVEYYAQAPIPMGGSAAWVLYLGKA